jgi:hypothetical protein
MTTAATSLLGLALPVTGELSGTWGDVVNASITNLLDSAIAGTTTLSSDADVTLTTTTLAANQAREAILLWTASGTVTRTITAPAQSKAYIVVNKTGSTQSIKLVGSGPTTGITIAAGEACLAAWNGVDFVKVSSTVAGVVPAASGGTGVANNFTITLAGALATAGAYSLTLTTTAGTNVTLPTTGTLATLAGTETLTNKRVTPRVLTSTANSATPTLNTDSYDSMVITGQSVAITSFTTNLTGTPTSQQKLIISITGTSAIAITWGASFEASTVALPTTTVTTNRLDVGFIWNAVTSKWRCVASA